MTANPYAVLAYLYDDVGLSAFTRRMTPRVIDYAQQTLDWVGRSVVDLGSGTGAAARWLANTGYAVTAVDMSSDMLSTARRGYVDTGLSLAWEQADVRTLNPQLGPFDLALALDVMNEMASLRDLEQAFTSTLRILEAGKPLIFDMVTIQGLSELGERDTEIVFEDERRFIVALNRYDYDRQLCQVDYRIFQSEGDMWRRETAQRTLRAYPVQAVAALLQRTGYEVVSILTTAFDMYQSGTPEADRALFIARKPGGSA